MKTVLEAAGVRCVVESTGQLREVAGGWVTEPGPVTISYSSGATHFYRHGWHSWAVTHWAALDDAPLQAPERFRYGSEDARIQDGTAHRGSWVGAIESSGGPTVVLGALGLDAYTEATPSTLNGVAMDEPVPWFIGIGDAEATLQRYAEILGERFGGRAVNPGNVWCSWYSYYTEITEPAMLEVLDGLADLPFDVVQIDDGWQVEVGDWDVNGDFPSGMAAMATEIASRGFRPGLWIAPFIAVEGSTVFEEHRDWFIGGPDRPEVAGFNWEKNYYGLDLTHPDARRHVRDIIATAVKWGYTYLKLDFLFAAAIPGARVDASISPEAAYRQAVEQVREAAGDETYLLACGSPILPSLGVFDGMRIGQDVAADWEPDPAAGPAHYSSAHTRYAISNSHSRLWLAPVVALDPDVVYFRSRANRMTADQVQNLQDIAAVCDFLATSDPPHWLTGEERATMITVLRERPPVTRLDRYRFTIGDREVSFRAASLDAPR